MATWNMEQLADDLQEVAIYPERWPAVLETMCAVTGAYGGLLFSTEKRLIRPPGTANLDKMVEEYATEEWYKQDVRFTGIPLMRRYGVITDFDVMSPDEMKKSSFYQDFLGRKNLQWFAGVGFSAGAIYG